jgi:hypothetical protein
LEEKRERSDEHREVRRTWTTPKREVQLNFIKDYGTRGKGGDKMGAFGKLFGKRKEETKNVEEKTKGKIELSFNLEELGLLSIFAPPGELTERVENARKMLKQKMLETVGIELGSKEFKDMIRLRTLVSSDPETSRLIRNAKETYSRIYGMSVTMNFTEEQIKNIIDSSKHTCGPSADALRRKLSEAHKK